MTTSPDRAADRAASRSTRAPDTLCWSCPSVEALSCPKTVSKSSRFADSRMSKISRTEGPGLLAGGPGGPAGPDGERLSEGELRDMTGPEVKAKDA